MPEPWSSELTHLAVGLLITDGQADQSNDKVYLCRLSDLDLLKHLESFFLQKGLIVSIHKGTKRIHQLGNKQQFNLYLSRKKGQYQTLLASIYKYGLELVASNRLANLTKIVDHLQAKQ